MPSSGQDSSTSTAPGESDARKASIFSTEKVSKNQRSTLNLHTVM